MHHVALAQQELGQVGAVLTCDPGDERYPIHRLARFGASSGAVTENGVILDDPPARLDHADPILRAPLRSCGSIMRARAHYTINQNNQGLAAARNNGIAATTGKYILP